MNSKCDYSIHRIEPPRRWRRRKRRRMRSDWGLWTELWVIPCRHVLISKEIHSQDAIGTREKRRRGNLWWACEDDWITVYGHSKESNHRRLIKAGNLMGGWCCDSYAWSLHHSTEVSTHRSGIRWKEWNVKWLQWSVTKYRELPQWSRTAIPIYSSVKVDPQKIGL